MNGRATRFAGIVASTGILLAIPLLLLADDGAPRVDTVLTREQQSRLTPDEVLKRLEAGNQRFAAGERTVRDHSKQVRAAAGGQYPKAMILSCIDSRIPVEDVLDQGIGDVFVARVAGNFENTDILGSMEYACKVSGAKVVLVLGHEHCGAVKAAIDGVVLGNITAMLENIRPAVESVSGYAGPRTSDNPEFVHRVAEQNVRLTMDRIRERSPILKAMEDAGEIRIVGGLYEMKTGRIDLLD